MFHKYEKNKKSPEFILHLNVISSNYISICQQAYRRGCTFLSRRSGKEILTVFNYNPARSVPVTQLRMFVDDVEIADGRVVTFNHSGHHRIVCVATGSNPPATFSFTSARTTDRELVDVTYGVAVSPTDDRRPFLALVNYTTVAVVESLFVGYRSVDRPQTCAASSPGSSVTLSRTFIPRFSGCKLIGKDDRFNRMDSSSNKKLDVIFNGGKFVRVTSEPSNITNSFKAASLGQSLLIILEVCISCITRLFLAQSAIVGSRL